jgi:DNA-binding MarR family transcriptional regulator
MKTNVASTSIAAYHNFTHHYTGIKGRILDALEVGKKYTRREIANLVGIDYSCASGRVKELLQDGVLVEPETAPRGYKGCSVGLVELAAKQLELV